MIFTCPGCGVNHTGTQEHCRSCADAYDKYYKDAYADQENRQHKEYDKAMREEHGENWG